MQRGEFRGRRFLAPGSLELLSYPLPRYLLTSASQQQLAAGAPASSAAAAEAAQRQRQQQRQQYGVRLRVAGSGWSPPLALDPGELAAGAAGSGGGVGSQGQQAQVGARQGWRSESQSCIACRVPVMGTQGCSSWCLLNPTPLLHVSRRRACPLAVARC